MSKTNETKSRVKLPDEKVSLEITEAFDNPDSINIGQMFMEARAIKGLTQEQASRSLKVREKIIKSLGFNENVEGFDFYGTLILIIICIFPTEF